MKRDEASAVEGMGLAEAIGEVIKLNSDVYREGMTQGADTERRRLMPLLQAIFNAYRQALADPKTLMPTALHLALANAQRTVGEIRGLQPARRFVYQTQRDGGGDIGPGGTQLRPGS